jgi:hypothetical protein
MKQKPGYHSWKNKQYPKGTDVYVFSKDKKFKGVGKMMTDFPSPIVIINFNEEVMFAGDDCHYIPVAEVKKKLTVPTRTKG